MQCSPIEAQLAGHIFIRFLLLLLQIPHIYWETASNQVINGWKAIITKHREECCDRGSYFLRVVDVSSPPNRCPSLILLLLLYFPLRKSERVKDMSKH